MQYDLLPDISFGKLGDLQSNDYQYIKNYYFFLRERDLNSILLNRQNFESPIRHSESKSLQPTV